MKRYLSILALIATAALGIFVAGGYAEPLGVSLYTTACARVVAS